MRHASWILALFAMTFGFGRGSGSLLTWSLPEHPDPPFATQLRKMPVVIQITCKGRDGKMFSGRGTGFTVAYVNPRLPSGSYFPYFVTNRHVAECWDEEGRPREIQSTSLWINLKGGGSVTEALSSARWYFPTDESADLAVTMLRFNRNADLLAVPLIAWRSQRIIFRRQCR